MQGLKYQAGPLMVPAYLNVRATGGAVKPLARSIFDRLLPAGRKNDWRGVWGVVRGPP